MDYRLNMRSRKYNESHALYENPFNQTFSRMYEMARKSSMEGGHIGDYSKEFLEKPSKKYEGKMPRKGLDQNSAYQFLNRFSLN
jgi:hypothetical protein